MQAAAAAIIGIIECTEIAQIAAQLAELRAQEEHMQRLRASLAQEKSEMQKREAIVVVSLVHLLLV